MTYKSAIKRDRADNFGRARVLEKRTGHQTALQKYRTAKIREIINRQHSHASGDRWHPPRVGKIGPDRLAGALALVCGERIELDTVAVRPLLTEIVSDVVIVTIRGFQNKVGSVRSRTSPDANVITSFPDRHFQQSCFVAMAKIGLLTKIIIVPCCNSAGRRSKYYDPPKT
jgi:hypothetical protein